MPLTITTHKSFKPRNHKATIIVSVFTSNIYSASDGTGYIDAFQDRVADGIPYCKLSEGGELPQGNSNSFIIAFLDQGSRVQDVEGKQNKTR